MEISLKKLMPGLFYPKARPRTSSSCSLSKLDHDVFQCSVKKFPNFKCDTEEFAKADLKKHSILQKQRHSARMKKYGKKQDDIQPRKVTRDEYKAILDVQYEREEYITTQEKLKKHIPLSSKEEKFLSFILSQMKPTDKKRVLWRAVGVYSGFEKQIQNGILKLDCLTSTNSSYNSFFEFWPPESFIIKDNEIFVKEGYMLKFNVPKGTKLLDCNAFCSDKDAKTDSVRSKEEVVLPPSVWKVNSIDNKLKVIELSPLKTNEDINV